MNTITSNDLIRADLALIRARLDEAAALAALADARVEVARLHLEKAKVLDALGR